MTVLVILPCETFDVVFASRDGALFRPLVLVGEHVCPQILEDTSTFWKRALALLPGFILLVSAAYALVAGSRTLRVKRGH